METVEAKARGFTGATLTEEALQIAPIMTPLVNMLPRVKASCACEVRSWRTVTAWQAPAYELDRVTLTLPAEPVQSGMAAQPFDQLIVTCKQAEEAYYLRTLIQFAHDHAATESAPGAQVRTASAFDLALLDDALTVAWEQQGMTPDVLVMGPNMAVTYRDANYFRLHGETYATVRARELQAASIPSCDLRYTHHVHPVKPDTSIPIIIDRYCPPSVILGLPLQLPAALPEKRDGTDVEVLQDYWGITFPDPMTDVEQSAVYVWSVPRVHCVGGMILIETAANL